MKRVSRARAEAVFDPIRKMLHAIEHTGEVDSVKGRPIFIIANHWTDAAPAIQSVIDYLEVAASRCDVAFDTGPLATLVKRLGNSAPLTVADCDRARECINRAVKLSMSLSLVEAADILRVVQIRHRMAA